MQKDSEGRETVVAYASCSPLNKAEKPYSTPEKECLAVIWALEHFRPYVEGLHMTIFTDHNSLRLFMSCPNPSGRLACWSLRLQDFDFSIVHKPGTRNPLPLTDDAPIDLLPDCAIIGSLDLCTLPPVLLAERSHLKELKNNDPDIGQLLRELEENPHTGSETAPHSLLLVTDVVCIL